MLLNTIEIYLKSNLNESYFGFYHHQATGILITNIISTPNALEP